MSTGYELGRYVVATWTHADGWDGLGWDGEQITRFERLMRDAAAKTKGRPALVNSWDDGRGKGPWYCARRGPEEAVLRAKCAAIFGCDPTEVG